MQDLKTLFGEDYKLTILKNSYNGKFRQADGIDAEVINARFLKPLDKEIIKTSIEKTKNVITMEDGTEINGLGTAVEELIVEENLQNIKFKKYAWPDEFIRHGSVEELEKIYCDFDSILEIKK